MRIRHALACLFAMTLATAEARGPLLLGAETEAAAAAASPEGRWNGKIEVPGSPLEVEVTLERDGDAWKGSITIPAQGAKDLPLEKLSVAGNALAFAISGIPGEPTFSGTLDDAAKAISGTFTQAGQSFPFALSAGPNRAERARAALEGIDAEIERAMEGLNCPGLGVGVVVDGEIVYAKGFGKRDIAKDATVTEDTQFCIGSITKSFTTLTLATLVDEGKIEWDKPVVTYLPDFRLYTDELTRSVTVRDLVTHRTGIPRHDMSWINNKDTSRQELFRRLAYFEPNKALREVFQYNNLMFVAAGEIIERQTGKTWEEAVRERVFAPLGFERAGFDYATMTASGDYAEGAAEDMKTQTLEASPYLELPIIGPAGSIAASAEEMCRYAMLFLGEGEFGGKRVVSAGQVTELFTPVMVAGGLPPGPEFAPESYGLGWFVTGYRGHLEVVHGGNTEGFSAHLTLFPDDEAGIIVMANKATTGVPQQVTRTIADRILGEEPIDWIGKSLDARKKALAMQETLEDTQEATRVQGTSPAHPLAAYAGTYRHPGYGTVTVEEKEGALALTYNGMTFGLEHWHFESFVTKDCTIDAFDDAGMTPMFRTNGDGAIDALVWELEPAVADIVFAREADARLSDPAYLARFAGRYVLADNDLTVDVTGTKLRLNMKGQPTMTLTPDAAGDFAIDGLAGYRVRFALPDGDGPATEAMFLQPNGNFPLKRAEE